MPDNEKPAKILNTWQEQREWIRAHPREKTEDEEDGAEAIIAAADEDEESED